MLPSAAREDPGHPGRCAGTPHPGFNLHFPMASDAEHVFLCSFALCTTQVSGLLLQTPPLPASSSSHEVSPHLWPLDPGLPAAPVLAVMVPSFMRRCRGNRVPLSPQDRCPWSQLCGESAVQHRARCARLRSQPEWDQGSLHSGPLRLVLPAHVASLDPL